MWAAASLPKRGCTYQPAARDLPHGVVGVDPAVPKAGVFPGGTEVHSAVLHALTDRVGGFALGGEQSGEPGHEGRRKACPAPCAVASCPTSGENTRSRSGQIHPVAAAGEVGQTVALVRGAYGDHLLIRRRVLPTGRPQARTLVAGRRHHDRAPVPRAVDLPSEYVGVRRPAKREVHDVGAVVQAPVYALDYPRVRGRASPVHYFGYEQSALETGPRHALAVIRDRARYARDAGAVPEVVVSHRVALHEVFLGDDPAHVRVARVGARINDGDPRPTALGVVPGSREPRLGEPPLVVELRVVRHEVSPADVVVIRGLDVRPLSEIPELPCEGPLACRFGRLVPDLGEGDEPRLPWKILQGPRPRVPDDGGFGLLGCSRLVGDE